MTSLDYSNGTWVVGWAILVPFFVLAMVGAGIFVWLAQRRGWMHWTRGSAIRVAGSYLLPLWAMLVLRLVFAAFFLAALIEANVYYDQNLTYFTFWNVLLLCIYFLVCIVFAWRCPRLNCFH